MDGNEGRLAHIEKEVRRIADSLDLLIRLDERTITLFKRQDDLEGRVRILEERSSGSAQTISAWTKLGWIVIGALVLAVIQLGREAFQRQPSPAYALLQPATDSRRDGK